MHLTLELTEGPEEVEIDFPTSNEIDPIEVQQPFDVIQRLKGVCFRGPSVRQAGNLFHWKDHNAFLNDPVVLTLMAPSLTEIIDRPYPYAHGPHRFEIKFEHHVGWDKVVYLDKLSVDDEDSCKRDFLNHKATALILPNDRIKAPLTKVVTMVVSVRHIGFWQFGIRDMYPGPDIGRVFEDMTDKHGLVWLRWSNPGEEEGEKDSSEIQEHADERLSA